MPTLLQTARRRFQEAADPARAPAMEAYLKGVAKFHGVTKPAMRAIAKELTQGLSWPTREAWEADVRAVWRGAKFREEQYLAMHLCDLRSARAFHTMESLDLFETMIVEGAWWDVVDEIAAHRLGAIAQAQPKEMKRAMLAWSRSDKLWKRRSAILFQLRLKGATDLKVLYACIEPAIVSKEFFLRKAIGWALRAYSAFNMPEVERYVAANRSRLSPLSQREALKHVI